MYKKRNENYNDDSIDLIELLSKIWKGKIFIVKTTILFTFIGIVYSLSLKNIYTASSVFYPHYQSNEISQNQGLRGLAGLAGINLGSQGALSSILNQSFLEELERAKNEKKPTSKEALDKLSLFLKSFILQSL